jgi:hypothetical protein
VSKRYGYPALEKVYPELDRNTIDGLLNETWNRPYIYQAYTQFRERPYTGVYVNVSEHGFRLSKNQGLWPPDSKKYNIFLFGGSTIFGYGLPDGQTIASCLQSYLSDKVKIEVKVYNFGCGHYISLQERATFERLLLAGKVPNMAVFVDGFNEFYHYGGEPAFTGDLAEFMENNLKHRGQSNCAGVLERLPVVVLLKGIINRLRPGGRQIAHNTPAENKYSNRKQDLSNDISVLKSVIDRYLKNKKIIESICGSFGVQPVFVWQPVSTYKYDLRYHLFAGRDLEKYLRSRYGYGYFAEYTNTYDLGSNFLWCADVQESFNEPLYVDVGHYTAKMSRIVAEKIANMIIERKLLNTVVAERNESREKNER